MLMAFAPRADEALMRDIKGAEPARGLFVQSTCYGMPEKDIFREFAGFKHVVKTAPNDLIVGFKVRVRAFC